MELGLEGVQRFAWLQVLAGRGATEQCIEAEGIVGERLQGLVSFFIQRHAMVSQQRLRERVVEILSVGAHLGALVVVLLPEGVLLRVE